MEAFIETTWTPESILLKTKLKGLIHYDLAMQWQKELDRVSQSIDRPFKFLFDNYNYEPASLDTHKAWREFPPVFLARHSLYISYLSDDDRKKIEDEYGKKKYPCIAMAMVHQNHFKMQTMNDQYGTENQRYYSNYEQAYEWIQSIPTG